MKISLNKQFAPGWKWWTLVRFTFLHEWPHSPEMGRKAPEGATQHVWEGEFWTASEVERTTEGGRAPQVHLFTKLWKIMFPFCLPHRLTRFPLLAVLPSSSCSPSFPHFPFLLTKKERKSANPVLAELELCVQAEYIEFFFPLPRFPFFHVTFCSMRFGEGDFYP